MKCEFSSPREVSVNLYHLTLCIEKQVIPPLGTSKIPFHLSVLPFFLLNSDKIKFVFLISIYHLTCLSSSGCHNKYLKFSSLQLWRLESQDQDSSTVAL